jgi:sec-independent protein translocase protein TatA
MEQLNVTSLNTLAMINMETGLIVLLIVLVLFGGSKIPQLMRGVGKGISEFQEGIKEGKNSIRAGLDESKSE